MIDPGEGDPNDPRDDDDQLDSDDDGSSDATEKDIGTDPFDPDTDADELGDGVEVRDSGTNPLDDDTHDDKLLDGNEDKDGDGVVDSDETNARKRDTDGDGLQDGTELGLAVPEGSDTDEAVFQPDADGGATRTDPKSTDTDGGTALDGAEDENHNAMIDNGERDPNDPLDDLRGVDFDGDGLDHPTELVLGTDPYDADTYDDGLPDGTEVDLITNPLEPEKLQGSASCAGAGAGGGAGTALRVLLLVGLGALVRRRRAGLAVLLLALGGGWAAPSAHAKAPPLIDAQRFDPVGQGAGFVRVREPEQIEAGQWAAGLYLNYALNPLELGGEDYGRRLGVVDHLIGLDVAGAFAFFDWLQVGASLPIMEMQFNDSKSEALAKAVGGSAGSFGIGDAKLNASFQLMRQEYDHLSLAVAPTIVLPTGSRKTFVGGGAVGIGLDMAVGYAWQYVRVAANLGFQINTAGRAVLGVRPDDELRLALAVGVPFAEDWEASVEWLSATVIDPAAHRDAGVGVFDRAHTPMELSFGIRHDPWGPLMWGAGAGPGILSGYGTPDFRIYGWVGLGTEPDRDADGDGIEDRQDKCPALPEDFDGFQDDDGCSDPDNDGDGIPDVADKCPNEAEDMDGFADGDGCPEPDNDGDGVPDADDKCPGQAEDFDGFADDDGCPDPDNDRDGIADADDKCPNEPETVNAVRDDDGCPDESLAQVETRLGVTKIRIFEKIYFDVDKARIKPISYPVLDAVVQVLKQYPQLKKLSIEGHTDWDGEAEYNQKLSWRRANSVMLYLIKAGVDPERLEAIGYGETRPIRSNETAAGKAANRRVEFVVKEQVGKAVRGTEYDDPDAPDPGNAPESEPAPTPAPAPAPAPVPTPAPAPAPAPPGP